jgi:hypothetical protein
VSGHLQTTAALFRERDPSYPLDSSFFFLVFLEWGQTESTWYVGKYLAYCTSPRMVDDECGVVGGMRIGRGNRSTRRKPAPVPLCPPQKPT